MKTIWERSTGLTISILWLHAVAYGADAGAEAKLPPDPALRERCLAVLREAFHSDEFWPAMHAAEGLTLAGQRDEVLAGLKLRTAADDQQRCGLAREAARAGDRSQIAVLLEILDKPGSNGHIHAAESLFKVYGIGDGVKLRAAMTEPGERKLQMMAAAALARCGHPTALDSVRRQLFSDNFEDRKVAVWILGQIGSAADVGPLKRGLETETDELTHAYFVHALCCLGSMAARPALKENLSASNPAVRTYATEFAGYCRAMELRDKLVELLSDPVLDVRVRSAQTLIVLASSAKLLGRPVE